ncbi:MAG: hypothetical protein JWN72_1291 [Thermoleophilia bacterium]|nr:hypothetical protein [Thermoleophilia bacterium]
MTGVAALGRGKTVDLKAGIIVGASVIGALGAAAAGIGITHALSNRQQSTDEIIDDQFGWLHTGSEGVSIADAGHVEWSAKSNPAYEGYADMTGVLTRIDSHEGSGARSAYRAGVDIRGDGRVTQNEVRVFVNSFDTDGAKGLAPDERAAMGVNRGRTEVVTGKRT